MAKILNNILCTVMVFLLCFAWTVYCLKNAKIALVLSLVVAACACYVIFAVLNKLETKQKNKQLKRNQLKSFATLLQFNEDNCKLFLPLLQFYGYVALRVDYDNATAQKGQKYFVTFCHQKDVPDMQDVQKAVVNAKRHNCQKLIVFCNKIGGNLCQLANSQLPTQFVDLPNTLALFVQAEMLPELPQNCPPIQHVLPQYVFNKRRFGWYFCSAFFTLATSFVSLFKVYLLVWSTVLFGLALFCLFNKRYNKISTNVTL